MDENSTNTPQEPQKSPVVPPVGIIGIIIALVIIILVSLNYFNILPFSLFFLPHKANKTITPASQTANPVSEPTCQFLPKGTDVKLDTSSSSASSQLKSLVGIWEGKWGNTAPSSLIIKRVTPKEASVLYIFKNKTITSVASLPVIRDNKLSNGVITLELASDGLHGSLFDKGKVVGIVTMKKCKAQ